MAQEELFRVIFKLAPPSGRPAREILVVTLLGEEKARAWAGGIMERSYPDEKIAGVEVVKVKNPSKNMKNAACCDRMEW